MPGATAHVITADQSRTDATPRLAEQIRAKAGNLDAFYQSLHAEVAEKGVYVGMLYIGAAIENSAFHTEMEKAKAAGEPVWEMPTVDPTTLADLLWRMHSAQSPQEARYPERPSGR